MSEKQSPKQADKQQISLSVVKELLNQQRLDFQATIESLMKSYNDRFDQLQRTVIELKTSLEFSQNQLDSIIKNKNDQDGQFILLQGQTESVESNLEDIAEKVDYIENQSRRNNLKFDGIPETSQETWEMTEGKVVNVLKSKLGIQESPRIERAHRVGVRSKANSPRSIVVKFAYYKDRDAVYRNRRLLKGSSIYVNEDLSERIMAKRRAQMDRLIEARNNNKIAYFSYDRLVIKEKLAAEMTTAAENDPAPSGPKTRSRSVRGEKDHNT